MLCFDNTGKGQLSGVLESASIDPMDAFRGPAPLSKAEVHQQLQLQAFKPQCSHTFLLPQHTQMKMLQHHGLHHFPLLKSQWEQAHKAAIRQRRRCCRAPLGLKFVPVRMLTISKPHERLLIMLRAMPSALHRVLALDTFKTPRRFGGEPWLGRADVGVLACTRPVTLPPPLPPPSSCRIGTCTRHAAWFHVRIRQQCHGSSDGLLCGLLLRRTALPPGRGPHPRHRLLRCARARHCMHHPGLWRGHRGLARDGHFCLDSGVDAKLAWHASVYGWGVHLPGHAALAYPQRCHRRHRCCRDALRHLRWHWHVHGTRLGLGGTR